MLKKIEQSLYLLKEATNSFWAKLFFIKKEKERISSELNKRKDEEKIKEVKGRLGL